MSATQDANGVMLVGAGAAAELLGDAADALPCAPPRPLAVRVLQVIEREEDGLPARPRARRRPRKPVDDTYWPVATDVAM
ncbi:MAG: hypothetical protein KGQ37_01520 [Hyphomicrobiales bacterium]|nr:hypothetical protein [Hyphomicrobiales bacterium]